MSCHNDKQIVKTLFYVPNNCKKGDIVCNVLQCDMLRPTLHAKHAFLFQPSKVLCKSNLKI